MKKPKENNKKPQYSWSSNTALGKIITPKTTGTSATINSKKAIQQGASIKRNAPLIEGAQRRQRIADAEAMKASGKQYDSTENFAIANAAIGDKLRLFEHPNFVDDWINPAAMVGNMASGLASVPDNLKKGNYGSAALAVGLPLGVGALGGLSPGTTNKQFVNNIFNPLPINFGGTSKTPISTHTLTAADNKVAKVKFQDLNKVSRMQENSLNLSRKADRKYQPVRYEPMPNDPNHITNQVPTYARFLSNEGIPLEHANNPGIMASYLSKQARTVRGVNASNLEDATKALSELPITDPKNLMLGVASYSSNSAKRAASYGSWLGEQVVQYPKGLNAVDQMKWLDSKLAKANDGVSDFHELANASLEDKFKSPYIGVEVNNQAGDPFYKNFERAIHDVNSFKLENVKKLNGSGQRISEAENTGRYAIAKEVEPFKEFPIRNTKAITNTDNGYISTRIAEAQRHARKLSKALNIPYEEAYRKTFSGRHEEAINNVFKTPPVKWRKYHQDIVDTQHRNSLSNSSTSSMNPSTHTLTSGSNNFNLNNSWKAFDDTHIDPNLSAGMQFDDKLKALYKKEMFHHMDNGLDYSELQFLNDNKGIAQIYSKDLGNGRHVFSLDKDAPKFSTESGVPIDEAGIAARMKNDIVNNSTGTASYTPNTTNKGGEYSDDAIDAMMTRLYNSMMGKDVKLSKLHANYPSQYDAVSQRAMRLQKQEAKWAPEIDRVDLHDKLRMADEWHVPDHNSPGESLGFNDGYGTYVSKHANLTEANKARIAAHETGHYYRNTPKEGADWSKDFDFSHLSPKISKYLYSRKRYGQNKDFAILGDEIKERAAQLKDFIAHTKGISLSDDFVVTAEDVQHAMDNYVSATGLDNNMSQFISGLKPGSLNSFVDNMNKYPLGVAGAGLLGTGVGLKALQKENSKYQSGGYVNNSGYTPGYQSYNNPYNIIPSNNITMRNTPFPIQATANTGERRILYPGQNYKFKGASNVLEVPLR